MEFLPGQARPRLSLRNTRKILQASLTEYQNAVFNLLPPGFGHDCTGSAGCQCQEIHGTDSMVSSFIIPFLLTLSPTKILTNPHHRLPTSGKSRNPPVILLPTSAKTPTLTSSSSPFSTSSGEPVVFQAPISGLTALEPSQAPTSPTVLPTRPTLKPARLTAKKFCCPSVAQP